MAKYLFEPSPNDVAVAFLREKAPLSVARYERLLPELRAHAFMVSGVANFDALQAMRDAVATVPAGGDYRAAKAAVVEVLAEHLPMEADLFEDEEAAAKARAKLARRAEAIVRNNAFQGYSASAYAELAERRDLFTHWQYITVGDERVRASHRALNHVILPADHEFWRTHFPPWEFQCRCQVVGLTPSEVEEERAKDAGRAVETRRVIEGAELEELETTRALTRAIGGAPVRVDLRAPVERGDENPWRWAPEDLALSWADVRKRYDAATWRQFEAWAAGLTLEDGRTLETWLRGAMAGGRRGRGRRAAVKKVVEKAATGAGAFADLDAAETLAEKEAALAGLEVEALEIERGMKATREKLAALEYGDPAFSGTVAELRELRERQAESIQKARAAVAVPTAKRGRLPLDKGRKTKNAVARLPTFAAGVEIVESYTAAAKLPKVTVSYRAGRAYATPHNDTIHLGATRPATTVAHEITHLTEVRDAEALKASQDFLLSRRRGAETGTELKALFPDYDYGEDEIAFEDEWLTTGGSYYAGKLYPRGVETRLGRDRWKAKLESDPEAAARELVATELLTMGIERLHLDPLKFRREDPAYFRFVVTTLQGLNP